MILSLLKDVFKILEIIFCTRHKVRYLPYSVIWAVTTQTSVFYMTTHLFYYKLLSA